MSLSSNKIGFWSVFELVTISQIGSGLMLPAQLAIFGTLSLIGWIISGLGALILAIVFAELCVRNPKMGGPHAYIKEAFGPTAAFFSGWTYWIISWVSTVAIITSAVGYISPLLGSTDSTMITLSLEIAIISWATLLNLKGAETASKTKLSTIMIKVIPLVFVPVIALFFFNKSNFTSLTLPLISKEGLLHFNSVILITLWGFVGFESATATADKIDQPTRTIRYAMILGTLFVASLYFMSTLGILGMIPGEILMHSKAPYADAAFIIGGRAGYVVISVVCAVICLGAVNAWTLASSHIALGATQEGLMPNLFAKTNKHGAPTAALLIGWLGTIFILILIHKASLAQQINMVIDLSVITFLFIYMACCLAYLKILYLNPKRSAIWKWACGLISLAFCTWIIASTDLNTLIISGLFFLSGIPIFLLRAKKILKPALNPTPVNQTF